MTNISGFDLLTLIKIDGVLTAKVTSNAVSRGTNNASRTQAVTNVLSIVSACKISQPRSTTYREPTTNIKTTPTFCVAGSVSRKTLGIGSKSVARSVNALSAVCDKYSTPLLRQ